ncbi:Phage DNA invertase [Salmonella enterica]|nr:Phage DNA invertase [Salmonella enterica]
MGHFFFHIMGALAEMERELIVGRTRAGPARYQGATVYRWQASKLPPEQWAQAGCLIGAVVPRQQVAIIYDVGLSCTENSRPQNWLKYARMTTQSENLQNP